jgi:UDP-glucose 4-epimerase
VENILVTGGAGFIGSHTVVELLNRGFNVTVVDNLMNSKEGSIRRVKTITNKELIFHKLDLLDRLGIDTLFKNQRFDSVIHFAGLKAVGESNSVPLHYYDNNVAATINLCQVMKKYNVKNLVFSSSATVYGNPEKTPIKEDFARSAANPYGRTKLIIEYILEDLYSSDASWNITLLRYFNPIGAHPSGLIGEDPNDIPNNLMPYISQVAIGKLKDLSVFGDDYPTHDGTGVRDYIHVVDLARGHLHALDRLDKNPGLQAYNLGTGQGYSVLDLVSTFERIANIKIPHKIVGRRPGDAAICYSDPTKAKKELNWRAEFDLENMCKHAWNWQMKNPNGYN